MPQHRPVKGSITASLQEATDVAGDRWVLLTLAALADGPRRFGDLIGDLGGIAPNVLTDRLRRMERHGIVTAALYTDRPRRYVYDLTESGHELAAILPALSAWAARRSGGEPLRHDVCGTPLEARVWCPACMRTVDDGEHDDHGDHGDPVSDRSLRWL